MEQYVCVDLTHLNKAIKCERLQLQSEVEIPSQLNGSTIFFKLDANSSYWQIPLTEKMQTSHYIHHSIQEVLPFGISSATEHFERRMQKMMQGVPGVICHADGILASAQGKGQAQHDANLAMALQWLSDAGATLNDKCEFSRPSVAFWDNQISADVVKPLPERTQVIINMPNPQNVTEVRRFLGMANQLGKYAQSLAEDLTPLRSLLVKSAALTLPKKL